MNYQEFWDGLASRDNWQEYILPKRSPDGFHREGYLQALELMSWWPMEGTVLEHGCGVGRVLQHVEAKRRIGVDVSQRFLDRLPDNVEPVLSDGLTIPLKANIADFTYSLMVFQHCLKTDHFQQLLELVRVTKGSVLVQFPKYGYYADDPGTNVYMREELEDLADALPVANYLLGSGSLFRYADGQHANREWWLELICL